MINQFILIIDFPLLPFCEKPLLNEISENPDYGIFIGTNAFIPSLPYLRELYLLIFFVHEFSGYFLFNRFSRSGRPFIFLINALNVKQ